jgi:hypothetical protein
VKTPKGNQNVHSDEEQTIKWPKEKVLKDKQQSTKHTHKTKATKNLTTYLIESPGPCCCRRVYVLWNICVTKDHGYIPVAFTTFRLLSPMRPRVAQ